MKKWNKGLGIFVMTGLLTAAIAAPVAWAQNHSSGTLQSRPRLERSAPPHDPLRGIVDPAVIKSAIAETLGLTEAEVDAAHAARTKLEELAAARGVTLAAVQTAAKRAAIAQINSAVTAGKITQAKADELITQLNNSNFPLRGPGPDQPRPDDRRRDRLDHEAIKAVVAETLGITLADLEAAHEAPTPLEELATTHGVTIEAVQAAAKATAIDQIKAAVTAGKITQVEADTLIDHITNSDFPVRGPGPDQPRPGDGLADRLDHEPIKAVVAQTLGITVETLAAAHEAGTPLETLAATQGVALETVQAAAKAAAITQINQAVTDGKLTPAEADQLIAQINNSRSHCSLSRQHRRQRTQRLPRKPSARPMPILDPINGGNDGRR